MADFDAQSGRGAPDELGLTGDQRQSDDEDVTAALQDLSGLVTGAESLEVVLGQIAGFALLAVPRADGVGVTLVDLDAETPAVLSWAATAPFVREIDRLQYEVCHEGPCLTAMQTGRPLVSGSLGSDTRWPRFGGRVARLGVHSALASPLMVGSSVVGALNVYAYQRDVFGEHAVRLAGQFAGPAAVSVHNTRVLQAARNRAAHLQTALSSRATIDQAIGILRSRSGGSAEEAMARLREISQSEQRKLAAVAQQIVQDAVRRAHARRGR